jgi:hypothetical protein
VERLTRRVRVERDAEDFDPESRSTEALQRHFWVRPDADDPYGLVSELLEERGVTSVRIEGWGEPFEQLLFRCFGGSRGKPSLLSLAAERATK